MEATVNWNIDLFFIAASFFLPTILLLLAKHIYIRSTLLSSFNSKICILLARKQFCWPVIFGTDSGNWQQTNVHATKLPEAVSFAKGWELDGIVLASKPFVFTPHLVGFIQGKEMGWPLKVHWKMRFSTWQMYISRPIWNLVPSLPMCTPCYYTSRFNILIRQIISCILGSSPSFDLYSTVVEDRDTYKI